MSIKYYFIFLFMVMALSLQMAATSGDSRTMMAEYLDELIANSDRVGSLTDSSYETVRHLAEQEKIKSEYFKRNRERLLREMQASDVKPYQIDQFLLNDFQQHHDSESASHRISVYDSRYLTRHTAH